MWLLLLLSFLATLLLVRDASCQHYAVQDAVHFTVVETGQTIYYQPAQFGPNLVVSASGPDAFVNLTLVLAYPDMYGCNLGKTAMDGTTYAGKAVVMMRSQCGNMIKAKSAADVGAAIVLFMNCAPPACADQRFAPIASAGAPVSAYTVPYVMVSYDADLLATLQTNRSLTARMEGTTGLDANEWNALRQMANASRSTLTTVVESFFNLNWNDVLLPGGAYEFRDPCLHRLNGIWCVGKHVTNLNFGFLPFGIQSLDGISALTHLTKININNQLVRSLTCELATLSRLIYLCAESLQIQTVPPCLAQLTTLQFLSFNGNQIGHEVASLVAPLTQLVYLDVGSNRIVGTFPTFNGHTQLLFLGADYNQFSGAIPSFQGAPNLQYAYLSNNQFTGLLHTGVWDGLLGLEVLYVQSNTIDSALPSLVGARSLRTLMLQHNRFRGEVPQTWTDMAPALAYLDASFNRITSETPSVSALNKLLALQTMLLNDNRLNNTALGQSVGQFLSNGVVPVNVRLVNVSSNALTGTFGAGVFQIHNSLTYVYAANNKIADLPSDMFGAWSSQVIQVVDFSSNSLSGDLPSGKPKTSMSQFLVGNNPGLQSSSGSLPSWLFATNTYTKTSLAQAYSCPMLQNTDGRLTVVLDPTYYRYSLCECDRGTYGVPPACPQVPSQVAVPLTGNQTATAATNGYFTDATYGDKRLIVGFDNTWTLAQNNGSASTTVRVVHIVLYVNTDVFRDVTDALDVYKGDASLVGVRVESIRGNVVAFSSPLTTVEHGRTPPADAWKTMATNNVTGTYTKVTVQVLASSASIHFKTYRMGGLHVVFTYTTSNTCPSGYTVSDGDCRLVFVPNASIKIALWVAIALVLAIECSVLVLMCVHRNTVLMRASSFPLCVFIALCFMAWTVGALFYTLPVDEYGFTCALRPWFAALPGTAVLAILIFKTLRVYRIFNSANLAKKLQLNVSNQRAVGMACLINVGQLALLVVHTASQLNQPHLAPSRMVQGGDGVEWTCASSDTSYAFSIWLAFELLYVCVLLVPCVYLAFQVREAPSSFHESSHILYSSACILFFLSVTVALGFIIGSDPDALMLIYSFGQCFGAVTVFLCLFAPKVLYIWSGEGNNSKLVQDSTAMGNTQTSLTSKRGRGSHVRNGSTAPTFANVIVDTDARRGTGLATKKHSTRKTSEHTSVHNPLDGNVATDAPSSPSIALQTVSSKQETLPEPLTTNKRRAVVVHHSSNEI